MHPCLCLAAVYRRSRSRAAINYKSMGANWWQVAAWTLRGIDLVEQMTLGPYSPIPPLPHMALWLVACEQCSDL